MTTILQRPLILHTTPDRFATWLEDATATADRERFESDAGKVQLGRARRLYPYSEDHIALTMYGAWIDALETKARPLDNAVTFTIHSLASDPHRIQVTTRCALPEVHPYLDRLADAIAAIWPEAGVGEPSEGPGADVIDADGVHVPSKQAVRLKWRRVWNLINGQVGRKSLAEISLWLEKAHPDLPRSRDTLTRIIRAGEAGKLG